MRFFCLTTLKVRCNRNIMCLILPKISIIVPVYNVENYVSKCLDSIINQSYKNLEIIIINDGSTDKSGEICEYYSAKDDRMVLIHQKNQGVSMARNNALDIAAGDYIGFIDSDDWIAPDMYSTLYKNAIEYDADISMCNLCYAHPKQDGEFFFDVDKSMSSTLEKTNKEKIKKVDIKNKKKEIKECQKKHIV